MVGVFKTSIYLNPPSGGLGYVGFILYITIGDAVFIETHGSFNVKGIWVGMMLLKPGWELRCYCTAL